MSVSNNVLTALRDLDVTVTYGASGSYNRGYGNAGVFVNDLQVGSTASQTYIQYFTITTSLNAGDTIAIKGSRDAENGGIFGIVYITP